MERPKRRRKTRKRKTLAKVKVKPQIKRKSEVQRIDTMPAELPRSNGVVFKVKMKKKN